MVKVLIVDDEKAVVELIASVVEELGYTPLCAYNGQEALDIALNEEPQIIFCDVMMPIMGGYELLDRLRDYSSLAKTPVVMMSAAKIDQKKAARAIGYMPKPFELAKIAQYIEKVG